MRLNKLEINNIKEILGTFLTTRATVEVYLYGSRIHDDSKGGDIDLVWVVPEDFEYRLNVDKYKILVKLKDILGDQKIDLSIASVRSLETDEFYKHIMHTAKRI